MNTRKHVIVIIIGLLLIVGLTYWFIIYRKNNTIEKLAGDYNSGNLDSVIENANKLLEKNQNDIEALLILATTYAQKGSVTFKEEEGATKAIEYADRVISLDPNNSEAYRIKGYAYEIQEKYQDAHVNYERAIELNKNNSQAYSNNGHAYDLEGDLIKAEGWYRKAIEINPSNDHALLNLGRLYIRQDKFNEAKITLDSLISSTANSRYKSEAHQLLSYLAYMEEDFEGALKEIETALSYDNTMSTAWVTHAKIKLGTALDMSTEEELNNLINEVKVSIDKALAINPNQAEAYLVLSEIEIITGDKEKEESLKKTALEAIPLDITLGKAEKAAMTARIESTIKVKDITVEEYNKSLNINEE